MKIRLSMQGASLNVEVSDKKAMGIYRELAERLLLQAGASESQTDKEEEAEKSPVKIVSPVKTDITEIKKENPDLFSPLIKTEEEERNDIPEFVSPLGK